MTARTPEGHPPRSARARGLGPLASPRPETGAVLDNLTHALVGAALSKAGAERTTPLATATLVVAANAPDVDIVAWAGGGYFALAVRRGITHGWPALLLWPFVVTGLVLGWDRWVRRRRDPNAPPARPRALLALAAAGVVTHPTLDWMNTYGMRWGLPFDGSWSYGDALFIVDPWLWLTLGGVVFLGSRRSRSATLAWGTAGAFVSLLVGAGGGTGVFAVWLLGLLVVALVARRSRPPSRRVLAGVVTACAAYVVVLLAADRAARVHVRDAATEAGLHVEDVMVAPSPAVPFRSAVEVRTADALVPGTHAWLRGPRVRLDLDGSVPLLSTPPDLSPSVATAIVDAARTLPDVRNYLVWSRYPYVRLARDGDRWRVRFADARYDDRPQSGSLGGVTVWIDDAEIP